MKLGLIPNISKEDIVNTVDLLVRQIREAGIEYALSNIMLGMQEEFPDPVKNSDFLPLDELIKYSDMVVSIGGDGTILSTAYSIRNTETPVIGVNLGKMGFLAEFDVDSFKEFLSDLKNGSYIVEKRMTLRGKIEGVDDELYAINDIVIDKGSWAKLIELTIKIDDDYVSTFSADGLIVATPTGSTGYSLAAGGPIVNPKAKAITLSPIAPHILTMRPLVISGEQKIRIVARSLYGKVNINCDGQRTISRNTPVAIEITKGGNSFNLVHSNKSNYFEILRNKLFWGLDIRNINMESK
ncbi:NAD(+)/NADH kinase [Melioribacter sp. Ez-97]|jgi:NAD+ kinase|uniref:NAD(+)/NADH kinase n=1 Tax=Melioribacter sp. Ez-97 TaxID=3423434 RepID=UPI003ED8A44C